MVRWLMTLSGRIPPQVRWGLLGAAAGLVLLTTLLPMPVPKLALSNLDKIEHFFAFLVLTVLMEWALLGRSRALTLVLMALFGLLIEAIQHQIPYREASFFDWVADVVGVICGIVLSCHTPLRRAISHQGPREKTTSHPLS